MSQGKIYRYQLPKKTIKGDCPQCSPRHRKTWSRYVDTKTGELLPESYGRCDRESNCGYHLSPYHKGPSGLSYSDEVYQQWKENNPLPARNYKPVDTPPPPPTAIYSLPDELFAQSLGHYEQNQFAQLLARQFGQDKATELLQRFQIGTSGHWPGATVFWFIDGQGRKRGGQIKLFNDDWHTAKYKDREGKTHSKTSWVHTALIKKLEKASQTVPDWLSEYNTKADKCPCLFGLPQLLTAPINYPVALVEAPKTAIICTALMPDFVWLAVGSLSNLTTATDAGLERLAPLRGRVVMLFPDLSKDGTAFARWSRVADDLNKKGYQVSVNDLLETNASDEQKVQGLDLADFLLAEQPRIDASHAWPGPNPPAPATTDRATTGPAKGRQYDAEVCSRQFWQHTPHPPLVWPKIYVAKFIERTTQPAPPTETSPAIVTTIDEQLASPGATLRPDETAIERLPAAPADTYPAEWDQPNPPDAVPTIRPLTFHQWQQQHSHFGQMGVNSIQRTT